MKLATYSKGIAAIDILPAITGQELVLLGARATNDADISGFVGWGRKKSGMRAAAAASKKNKSVLYLEDGFIGYWGHPSGRHTRLSLVVDQQGIYYDAVQPSDLESLIGTEDELTSEQVARAEALRQSLAQHRISKYNHHTSSALPTDLSQRLQQAERVCLVVDQTRGDESIRCGGASETSFVDMLDAAIKENPDALIVVKTHPDVICGKKASAIGYADRAGVLWISEDVHPHALIERVDKVYVVTSQLGFEALILGKPVVCFGRPFFAGWGLTDDRVDMPARRNQNVSLHRLIYQSLIAYPTYIHPDSGERCEPEQIIAWIQRQRRDANIKFKQVLAVGFSVWKRSWLPACTVDFAQELVFVRTSNVERYDDDIPMLVWGARQAQALRARFPGRQIFTAEDGFVRSAGLGTDLKRPSSLIIDRIGIYYDASRTSELEERLNQCSLTAEQLHAGRNAVRALIDAGATKYNIGQDLDDQLLGWLGERRASGQEIVLVPGQVEGDASIAFGSPRWKTNLELLKRARKDNPSACIIYKPHPDIVAKNRRNKRDFAAEAEVADRLVIEANIAQLYNHIDKVCTLTSQTGFEALLRGIEVVAYGLPFYAGWGLTHDQLTCDRRRQKLSLDALAYVCLLEYPRYVNWETAHFCSLQTVMRQLAKAADAPRDVTAVARWRMKCRNFLESRVKA
ncbi:MAG TPA: beta-3-deoxy-D-manno-oct-2-ulosonic acid transferase [Gammaproteobacteria bacterium]|jgi:capsular polysaccharide export protein|nr:beta-3-deoxy-D-manno-oct-2-ulosonic acid transferase [Gammaproteobacteria bacterium]